MNIDWKRKLSSRKLWVALAGLVIGVALLFGAERTTAESIGGIVLTFGSIVTYLLAEGAADVMDIRLRNEAIMRIAIEEGETDGKIN